VKERQDSRSVACLLLGFSGFEAPRVEGFFFGSIRDSFCVLCCLFLCLIQV